VLPGDSQKYIQGIYHRFRVDRKNPRVEVEIRGVSGEKAIEGQEWDCQEELVVGKQKESEAKKDD